MPIVFPPVEDSNEDGLLAIGGDLSVETLKTAYFNGIFPWPIDETYPLTWFSPDPRGILEFSNFTVSKSFTKFLKKTKFEVRFNEDFHEVISKCAKTKRKHEDSTWIYENIIKAYCQLFKNGKAYCVGTYLNGNLVGGLYGVCFGEIISGESMFYEEDNASKFALYHLVKILSSNNIKWIDTQMVTPVIKSFGGKVIPRKDFIKNLELLDNYRHRSQLFTAN